MFFLTHFKAGDDWLIERLQDYFGSSHPHRLEVAGQFPLSAQVPQVSDDKTIIVRNACGQDWTSIASRAVHVIRNPLSQLAGIHSAIVSREALPDGYRLNGKTRDDIANSRIDIGLRKLWLHLNAACSQTWDESVPQNDPFGFELVDSKQLVVRIEDLVAFPAVTLRRICDYFGVPMQVELVRAFVDFGRTRRQVFKRWGNEHRKPSIQAKSLAVDADERFDLFSWADVVPGILAGEIFAQRSEFLSRYYPEIASLFAEPAQTRLVG